LIAKLKPHDRIQVPVTEVSKFITESDVEQKLGRRPDWATCAALPNAISEQKGVE
jgi:hypothetical protein